MTNSTKLSVKIIANNIWSHRKNLFCLILLLAPLKLALCYIPLIPLILSWFLRSPTRFWITLTRSSFGSLWRPLWSWILLAILASFFGLDLGRSFSKLSSLTFFSLLIPITAVIVKKQDIFKFGKYLFAGSFLASFHTILNGAFPSILPKLFIGDVSESGQLAMTAVGAICTTIYLSPPSRNKYNKYLFFLILVLVFLISNFLPLANFTKILLLSISVLSMLIYYKLHPDIMAFLISATMISAILINLKRGPIFGVLCACSLYILINHRKLIIPFLVSALIGIAIFEPIHSRIIAAYQDFSLSGGRLSMWRVASELILKYPLGIGYENAKIMHLFDPWIPSSYGHFHNNLINIFVETGWIGLILYLRWLFIVLKPTVYILNNRVLSKTLLIIPLMIISWQLVGIFEYSFGDSEVRILAFIFIGLLTNSPSIKIK